MTVRAWMLRGLNLLSAALLVAGLLMGYGADRGMVDIGAHIAWGFGIALVVAFTHAMTVFYFAGMGVSLRLEAGTHPGCDAILAEAARLRRRLAPVIGTALTAVMAAAILGGGTHTRRLPSWPHHAFSLLAIAIGLAAHAAAWRSIASQEALVDAAQAVLPATDRP